MSARVTDSLVEGPSPEGDYLLRMFIPGAHSSAHVDFVVKQDVLLSLVFRAVRKIESGMEKEAVATSRERGAAAPSKEATAS